MVIIPEDPRRDQHILRPIFRRLFNSLGSRNAKVTVCQEPVLGGVGEALKIERLREIVERYPMVDMFLLCVDRDGQVGRRQRLDDLEGDLVYAEQAFLAENAWEEIETWALAGLRLPKEWGWSAVRAEVQVKEVYFNELARRRGVVPAADASYWVRRPRVDSQRYARSAPRTSIILRVESSPNLVVEASRQWPPRSRTRSARRS